MFNIIGEYRGQCLAVRVKRTMKTNDVTVTLTDLFIAFGTPESICSDNGSEFVADLLRTGLFNLHVAAAFIKPGISLENGNIGSFNGKFKDKSLNREIFHTVMVARVITEDQRKRYQQ